MDYTTLSFRNKLKKYGGLQHRNSCFDDFIWAFNDKRYEVLSIANGVLFHHLPPGDRRRPEPPIQAQIVRMITILHSDTYPDKAGWLGHPCIPRRVFGPKEYLVNPPLQLSKPQVTLRPLSAASGGSVLVQDQPQSKIGTFQPSGATSNTCTSKSKNTEDISSSIFMSWFETVQDLDTRIKCKALFACQEAASTVIAKEWCNVEDQTEVTHGRLNARRVEYCAEMADIRVVHPCRGPTSS